MNSEVWQQLLSLESRDVTSQWFNRIHGRELNTRRAKEINASAKQAREYFTNASNSNYSVRPLLTFYGVASLSRALILLLRREGGEETLTGSHGLESVNWGATFSGEGGKGLADLSNLKIRTTNGLFDDLVKQTQNKIALHIHSAAVDWSIDYDIPQTAAEITLGDLLSRLPDLSRDFREISNAALFSSVHELKYTKESGFSLKVKSETFSSMLSFYKDAGYVISTNNEWTDLHCDAAILEAHTPLFIHSYIQKVFGAIPELHVSVPFQGKVYYSQICITYMTAYVLGMLVRYYPTQWISLINGEKGDAWWPTLNRAQQFVESSYPEIVIEMITYLLKKPPKHAKKQDAQQSA